jgi:hypothetical protein
MRVRFKFCNFFFLEENSYHSANKKRIERKWVRSCKFFFPRQMNVNKMFALHC